MRLPASFSRKCSAGRPSRHGERGWRGASDRRRRVSPDLDGPAQDEVLLRIEHGDRPGATWTTLPAGRFFKSVLCMTIVKMYYAHPSAWNEVGYNGPSSPRGHMRIWEGGVDPWEAQETSTTLGSD